MKFIDIETIPQPGIMNTWFPEWARKKMPEASDEEIELSACLHGEFGMVCAIGMQPGGGEVCHVLATDFESEREALVCFEQTLSRNETLAGHNIKGFDIPFLAKRYLAHGMDVPQTLRTAGKKPWEIPHYDTMEMMRFGGDCFMSLRSACLLLGLGDPKADCSGGEVYELFKAGKMDLIGRYVESDVVYTAKVWRALMEHAAV